MPTNIATIGSGWELLEVCGKKITDAFAEEWFDGKVKGDWLMNNAKGIGVRLDHLQHIEAIFLFSEGSEEKRTKAFPGTLPGDVTWSTTRAAVHELFGDPSKHGEPSDYEETSFLYSPFAWDRWEIAEHGSLRIEYTQDEKSIRKITLQPVSLPEPTSVALQVHADYSQFYVADRSSTYDTSVLWDDPESTVRQFAPGDATLVGIGTKRYGTVPVRVECYPIEPTLDPNGIDRINECTLTITTTLGVGTYVSKTELEEVPLAPGTYGLRALYLFQEQVKNDQEGEDAYIIQLWPIAAPLPLRYIKP
jgi:hypothetical protein